MKIKICIVTGARAEYGLFYPLLKRLKDASGIELQLIVTGMHLSPGFGLTYKNIERDGFKINKKVNILSSGDSELGTARSIGLGMTKFAYVLNSLKPDMVVLLGDRFETFAAAIAAFVAKIPIAHIHGGELTEGAMDEGFRHSITKMSMLHFVSTDEYRKRVIQLGESPDRVFNVGALGLDNIRSMPLLTKDRLEKEIGFKFGLKNILVTFHPVTLERNTSAAQFKELLIALDRFSDIKVIFTKANSDAGGRIINKLIDKYTQSNPYKAISFISMGQQGYLSTMRYVDAVVGNSSSGILEAPSFAKPCVNIGDRQKGRVRAKNIIDCQPISSDIQAALEKALSWSFRRLCQRTSNPYGNGHTAAKITAIIKNKIGRTQNLKKSFYNIPIKNV